MLMLMSAVYTGTRLCSLQLLLPPPVDPRAEVWTAWVLQNTGVLLGTLPGGQWTPGAPPSGLHRSRLQSSGVVLPVTTPTDGVTPINRRRRDKTTRQWIKRSWSIRTIHRTKGRPSISTFYLKPYWFKAGLLGAAALKPQRPL